MESTSDQAAEGKAVVTVLAAVLERLVKSNANATKGREETSVAEVTKFHALKAPGISIKLYLERVRIFINVPQWNSKVQFSRNCKIVVSAHFLTNTQHTPD